MSSLWYQARELVDDIDIKHNLPIGSHIENATASMVNSIILDDSKFKPNHIAKVSDNSEIYSSNCNLIRALHNKIDAPNSSEKNSQSYNYIPIDQKAEAIIRMQMQLDSINKRLDRAISQVDKLVTISHKGNRSIVKWFSFKYNHLLRTIWPIILYEVMLRFIWTGKCALQTMTR